MKFSRQNGIVSHGRFVEVFKRVTYPSHYSSGLACLLMILILGSLDCAAFGQASTITAEVARPVSGVGHDYISSFSETVNPSTGTLNITLPLPTPKGRGFTLPVSLIYNSGQVNHFYSAGPGMGMLVSDSLSSMSSGGWSDTLPYATNADWTEAVPASLADANYSCEFTSSYTFYDPSGGSHMLGLAGISNLQNAGGGNFVDPNYCIEMNNGAMSRTNGGDSRVTAQAQVTCNGLGSGDSGMYPSCSYGALPFTVTELDGTVYAFPWNQVEYSQFTSSSTGQNGSSVPGDNPSSGSPVLTWTKNNFIFPTTIEDRNGNIMNVSVTLNQNLTSDNGTLPPTNETITDTAGRTLVSVQRPSMSALPTGYTVGGQLYTIDWASPSTTNYTLSPHKFPGSPSLPSSDVCYLNLSVPNNFNGAGFYPGIVYTHNSGTSPAINSITLPNGQMYQFYYGNNNPTDSDPSLLNNFGLLNEIVYPNGGWVKYYWKLSDNDSTFVSFDAADTSLSPPTPVSGGCIYTYQTPVVAKRVVGFSSGSSAALTQSFTYNTAWSSSAYGWNSKTTTVTTTDNVTGNASQTVYTYISVLQAQDPDASGELANQIPVESTVQHYDLGNASAPSNTLLTTVNKTWADIYEMTSERTQLANGLGSQTAYCYAGVDLLAEKDQYNYATPSVVPTQGLASTYAGCNPSSASRSTTYSYYNFAQPQTIKTYAAGALASETDVSYDQTSVSSAPNLQECPPQSNCSHDIGYAPGGITTRGNATTVSNWSNFGTTEVRTFTYDETGNVTSMTDPCGHTNCADMSGSNYTTLYGYADNYTTLASNQNVPYSPGSSTSAYLTSIINPLRQTQTFSYDYYSGQLTSTKDPNNQITTYIYNDPLSRPTQILSPDGGQTAISYQDSSPSITTSVLLNNSGLWKTSVSNMDGMGHITGTTLLSDPSGPSSVQSSYTGFGQLYTTTNPYRSTGDPTYGVTTFLYDALGQKIMARNADNSSSSWCYNGAPNTVHPSCPGLLASLYPSVDVPASWVDSYDELGSHHQHVSDGLGRMIAVMEPNGTSREPSMETDYIYDGLNNLLQAKQNGINGVGTPRTRTFVYDSLSRLQTSTNPETGTISYSYDANGNVHTKTDARGVVATYAYDNLNRLLSKSYTYDASGTPMSCYQYDLPSVTNGIGRLTSAWTQLASVASSCSTSAAFVTMRSILAYDPMGHLVSEQQYTPASMASGMTYAPKYTYDLAGNLTSSTDGVTPVPTQNTLSAPCLDTPVSSNMLTLVTCPDAGGHLQMVMSNWIDNTHPTWLLSAPPNAFQPSYAAFGGLMNATFGNAALTLNRTYDNRLRMTGEFDMGAAVPTATSSSATVSITGAEQSQ